MSAFWHFIAVGSIQPEWLYRDESNEKELNLNKFMEDKLKETNESDQEEGTHCDVQDEENTEDIGGPAMEVENYDEDLVEIFSKLWNRFGERVAQEILNNPEDIEWKKCAKAAMKILNEVDLYRPLTLRKHLHMFCTELEGKKEKWKKIRIINVQPASRRRRDITKRKKSP